MKRTYKILSGIALIASLGIATAVYAHGGGFGPGTAPCIGSAPGMSQGMGSPGHGPMGGMGGPQGMPGHMAGGANFDPAAMMEGRLTFLKSSLKITDQQDSAWQAFSAKAKQQGEPMLASRTAMHNATGSAPERMALRTTMMQQHLGNMETMNVALKDLYAVLTPEQKAVADQHFGHMRMAFGGQPR
ncbi:MAG: Spy/CpxP family protein refolding chaperone [Pseudomonadota bacterium]